MLILKILLPIVMLVCGMLIFSGKGAWLMAGYNTASAEEREAYHYQRLCHTLGALFFLIAFLLLPPLFISHISADYFLITAIILTVAAVFAVIIANTWCKRKAGEPLSVAPSSALQAKLSFPFLYGMLILFSIAVGMFFTFAGSVDISLHKDSLRLDATFSDETELPLSEITSISLQTVPDYGKRNGGTGNARIQAGRYHNDLWQDYMLYIYRSCSYAIVIQTPQQTLVCNESDETKTKQLYEQLQKRIPTSASHEK